MIAQIWAKITTLTTNLGFSSPPQKLISNHFFLILQPMIIKSIIKAPYYVMFKLQFGELWQSKFGWKCQSVHVICFQLKCPILAEKWTWKFKVFLWNLLALYDVIVASRHLILGFILASLERSNKYLSKSGLQYSSSYIFFEVNPFKKVTFCDVSRRESRESRVSWHTMYLLIFV